MKRNFIIICACLMLMTVSIGSTEILKTQLIVSVLNDIGNPIKGATVTLYDNEDNYGKQVNNVLTPQTTDEKGKTRFIGLEPIVYFVSAKKGDLDNFLRGEKTTPLTKSKMNKINVIID